MHVVKDVQTETLLTRPDQATGKKSPPQNQRTKGRAPAKSVLEDVTNAKVLQEQPMNSMKGSTEKKGSPDEQPPKARTKRPAISFSDSEDDDNDDDERVEEESKSTAKGANNSETDKAVLEKEEIHNFCEEDKSVSVETQAPPTQVVANGTQESELKADNPEALAGSTKDKDMLAEVQVDEDMEVESDEKSTKQATAGEKTKPDGDLPTSKGGPAEDGITRRLKKSTSAGSDEDDDDILFDSPTKSHPSKVSFIDDEAEDATDDVEEKEDDNLSNEPIEANLDSDTPTADPQSQNEDVDPEKDSGFPMRDDDDSREDDIDAITDTFPSNDYGVPPSGGYSGPVLPEPQAAFAPSSTPLDLPRRFLCWNSIGSITLINDEVGRRSTVDINFTDKAFRRPVSFTDNQGFILGSLGDDGALFATDVAHDDDGDVNDDEDDVMDGISLSDQTKAALRKSQKQRMNKGSAPKGSSLYFHRYATEFSLRDKDWYLTLPDGEQVLGCAAGLGWAAAVTR